MLVLEGRVCWSKKEIQIQRSQHCDRAGPSMSQGGSIGGRGVREVRTGEPWKAEGG